MACKDCVSGTLHSGTPTGTVETIHGLQTYVAASKEAAGAAPKATIVIIPDAFGWDFNNNRILADSYATKGPFRVLLPDFMNGNKLSPDVMRLMDLIMEKHESYGMHTLWKPFYAVQAATHFLPWILRCRWQKTWPGVQEWFTKLRAENSGDKIGAAGFCWGGKHTFLLAGAGNVKTAEGKMLIDAGFTAHPSFLTLPDDPKKIKVPVSVAIGTVDMQIPEKQIPTLQSGLKESGTEHEVKIYQDATHGFAVRANPAVPKENEQGLEAEDQAIAWFKKHLL